MFKGANLQLRPMFQRLEHNAAKGCVGVSPCTYGCVHCLVCFGSSSWAWFCITDGKHGILGLPPPPTLAGELLRALSSQASARYRCPVPTC